MYPVLLNPIGNEQPQHNHADEDNSNYFLLFLIDLADHIVVTENSRIAIIGKKDGGTRRRALTRSIIIFGMPVISRKKPYHPGMEGMASSVIGIRKRCPS